MTTILLRMTLVLVCIFGVSLIGHSIASAAGERVSVYRCMAADGKLSFQQSPCEDAEAEELMQVAGDSQANVDAARRLSEYRAEADMAARNTRMREQLQRDQAAAAQPKPPLTPPKPAPVVCPPTYENPGNSGIVGFDIYTDEYGRERRVARYPWGIKTLPSKGYLKKAGRWPKGCPD